ncbi:MAG: STAS domain-containing protein [bacterium]
MQFQEEKRGDVLIFKVSHPRLDNSLAPDFKTQMLSLIEKKAEKKILIDLASVEYVDSSGLGALLFGLRQAKAKSGLLKLLHTNQKVSNLLRIAKLEKVLESFEDEQQAVESFRVEHV